MKTPIDLAPLCRYVTEEVSPLYLLECLNGLSIDYIRLLLDEAQRHEGGEEISPQTYNYLFELYRINACLIEGMRLAQEKGAKKESLPERGVSVK